MIYIHKTKSYSPCCIRCWVCSKAKVGNSSQTSRLGCFSWTYGRVRSNPLVLGQWMPCSVTPEWHMTEVVRAFNWLRTDRRNRRDLRHTAPYLCAHHKPRFCRSAKSVTPPELCAVSVTAARSVWKAMKRVAVNSALIPVTATPFTFQLRSLSKGSTPQIYTVGEQSHSRVQNKRVSKAIPISFEVILPSACSFIVDGSLSYV
jgi:hypothetical protein